MLSANQATPHFQTERGRRGCRCGRNGALTCRHILHAAITGVADLDDLLLLALLLILLAAATLHLLPVVLLMRRLLPLPLPATSQSAPPPSPIPCPLSGLQPHLPACVLFGLRRLPCPRLQLPPGVTFRRASLHRQLPTITIFLVPSHRPRATG